MAAKITGIEKKGPVIICSTDDPNNRVYKLDFQEGKIYGISGKTIQSTMTIIARIPNNFNRDNPLCAALFAFTDVAYCQAPYYGIVESLLSYPDLLPSRINMDMVRTIINDYNGKLPKGYVKWCRENGKKIQLYSLEEFAAAQRLQQWPQSLVDSIKKFNVGTGFDLAQFTDYDKELCSSLIHIANNSLKRYEINGLLDHLQSIASIIRRNPQLRPYLDDTKNAKTAHQILQDVLNKERNDKILANEARIAALNGTMIDDFVIKVPSAMADFTDEGEQQHNCVGYYYHNAMANGDTLIYFLRHADTPDKSYVTCRYRTDKMKTVEHRLQFNCWFEDDALFKKIDKMIADILRA